MWVPCQVDAANGMGSDGEDLFLLGGEEFVNLLHVLVVELLHLVLAILLDILAHALLDGLLEPVDALASRVAHAHAGLLGLGLAVLDQLLASLLGQWRYVEAYDLAVVDGHDADVAVDDGFLNHGEHVLLPGLDGDGALVRCRDVGDVADGHLRAIIVDADGVENLHIGLAGADVCQRVIEEGDGFFHALLGHVEIEIQVVHCAICFRVIVTCGLSLTSAKLQILAEPAK